ncbi:PREDICTED: uncharacterized protein LOC108538816 [Rhinopithecus bieti]|uniref:uncharacterized protein LOC108538816 n=1 Tax=Rhinopithecus bieti TaxID=61621 RepID=UPI00083C5E1A|nr:PREDICTED: uncharacterized protein LOC108538816 [Rhinopithecus bieti]
MTVAPSLAAWDSQADTVWERRGQRTAEAEPLQSGPLVERWERRSSAVGSGARPLLGTPARARKAAGRPSPGRRVPEGAGHLLWGQRAAGSGLRPRGPRQAGRAEAPSLPALGSAAPGSSSLPKSDSGFKLSCRALSGFQLSLPGFLQPPRIAGPRYMATHDPERPLPGTGGGDCLLLSSVEVHVPAAREVEAEG